MSTDDLSTDRRVRERLKRGNEALFSKFRHAETQVHQLLEYSQGGTNIAFTPHGLSHITAVERAYDWLLGDEDVAAFHPTECFCLLMATQLHDALMIPRRAGDEHRARVEHAKDPTQFLVANANALGINQHEARAIGEIVRAHHAASIDEISEKTALGDAVVDLRKLGACLSMADICHADASRSPQIVFDYLTLDEENASHWRRHLDIGGVTRPSGSDKILMSAFVFSDDGERAVQDYAQAIREQLQIVQPYFHSHLTPIVDVELDLIRQNSPVERELKFKTDMSAILRILIEGVYERPDVFIRELTQNGLDACYLQAAHAYRRNKTHDSRIVLTEYVEHGRCRAVRIDDNGVGMDFTQIQDMLLLIGGTSTDRESVRSLLNETTKKNLIATFGVGILSCLKVADRLIVETAKAAATPVRLEISGVSEPIVSSEGSDEAHGTTIYVELSEEYRDDVIVSDSAGYFLRMADQADIRVLELPWSEGTIALTRDAMFASASTEGQLLPRVEPEGFGLTDIGGDDYTGWVWFEEGDAVLNSDAVGEILVLNDGIYVSTDSSRDWLPEYLAMCSGVLNFAARAVDLPVSRDRVMKNHRLDKKRSELRSKSSRALRTLSGLTARTQSRTRSAHLASALMSRATPDEQHVLAGELANYQVDLVGGDSCSLKDLSRDRKPIYVAYSEGRIVKPLAEFDGKSLFHREDDIVSLQSSWLAQQGNTVVEAKRTDNKEQPIREIDLLRGYFAHKQVPVVDLTEERPIEGQERSRPLPKESREAVGAHIKFVDFPGLAGKRGWRIGHETWLNLAHPDVEACYESLRDSDSGDSRRAAELFVKMLDLNFEYVLDALATTITELSVNEVSSHEETATLSA